VCVENFLCISGTRNIKNEVLYIFRQIKATQIKKMLGNSKESGEKKAPRECRRMAGAPQEKGERKKVSLMRIFIL
jgi:hypothetical protein